MKCFSNDKILLIKHTHREKAGSKMAATVWKMGGEPTSVVISVIDVLTIDFGLT